VRWGASGQGRAWWISDGGGGRQYGRGAMPASGSR